MEEIKKITINGKTYKLVDEQAMTNVASLDGSVSDLKRKVTILENVMSRQAVQYVEDNRSVSIISPVVVVAPGVPELNIMNSPSFGFSIYFAKTAAEIGKNVELVINDYTGKTMPYIPATGGPQINLYKGKWYTVCINEVLQLRVEQ